MITTTIYFIRPVGKSSPIKIGRSKGSVKKRLQQLQTASPFQLEIVATLKAHPSFEKTLHGVFAGARLCGEWFEGTAALQVLIWKIAAGAFNPREVSAVFDPGCIHFPARRLPHVDADLLRLLGEYRDRARALKSIGIEPDPYIATLLTMDFTCNIAAANAGVMLREWLDDTAAVA